MHYITQIINLKYFLGNSNKTLARISSCYKQCYRKHLHIYLVKSLNDKTCNIRLLRMVPRCSSTAFSHILIIYWWNQTTSLGQDICHVCIQQNSGARMHIHWNLLQVDKKKIFPLEKHGKISVNRKFTEKETPWPVVSQRLTD